MRQHAPSPRRAFRAAGATFGLATALLLSAIARPARAQLAPAPPARATTDSAPCWDCDRRRQFWPAVVELQLGIWPSFFINKFTHDYGISNVTPRFWWQNARGRWEWDPNSFVVNQFGHPFQGSMYYNGFRTNGYGFWGSQAAAFAGSFFWECCGERKLPSVNDQLTTWLGGAALGEVFRRVSDLALDNTATGGERVVREVAAGLVNPVRGFDRLIRGHAWRRGRNPVDARPDWRQWTIGTGFVTLGSERPNDQSQVRGAKLATRLVYGRPEAITGAPFSHFAFDAEFTTIPKAPIYLIRGRGSLFGRDLNTNPADTWRVASFIRYDYVRSRAFELGATSLSAGLERDRRFANGARIVSDVTLRAVPLAAIEDEDLTVSDEGRDYDYGYGGGIGTDLRFIHPGRGSVHLNSVMTGYQVAQGAAQAHFVGQHEIYAQIDLAPHSGVGLGARFQNRQSYFTGRPRTTAGSTEFWVSFVAALPRWEY
jgi:hypothetical protein